MFILLTIVYLAIFGIGMRATILGAAWPYMYAELGVHDTYLGIVATIMLCGNMVASTFSGKLLKRFDASIIAVVSMLIMSVSIISSALMGNFVFLCIMALPHGLAAGLSFTAFFCYISINFQAKYLNWLNCLWALGAAAGPIVMLFGFNLCDSWRMGYYLTGGFQLLMALVLFLSLPSLRKHDSGIKQQEAASTDASYKRILKRPGVILALLACFTYNSIEATINLWGSSYLVFVRGVSEDIAAECISLFFIGIACGLFLSGLLSTRLEIRRIIWLGCGLIAIGLSLSFTGHFNDWFYLTGFTLMGLGCAPIFPSLIYLTPVRFGKDDAPVIIGLQIAMAYLGSVASSTLGSFADYIYENMFSVSLVFLLASFAVIIKMLYRRNSQ